MCAFAPDVHGAPDGERFCRTTLAQIKRGQWGPRKLRRRCVVFDIDNTLVDKRSTTRAAALRFGDQRGISALANLQRRDMGWDGMQTARRAGLDKRSSERFHKHWERFFWSPKRFIEHDAPIAKTIALAKAAKAAGCEVYYLTGRYSSLKNATIEQLAKHGLPNADAAHVRCKPQGMLTATFKRTEMRRIQRRAEVLWFASDTRSDIAAIQRSSTVPCVLVDFPVKPPEWAGVRRGTPVIRIRP